MKEYKIFTDENGKTYTFKVETEEEKKTFKEKLKYKAKRLGEDLTIVGDYVIHHPAEVILLTVVAFKAGTALGNTYTHVMNARTNRRIYNDRFKTVYDNRSNMTYRIRRKMKENEKYEFSKRRRHGEDVGDILEDMNLI